MSTEWVFLMVVSSSATSPAIDRAYGVGVVVVAVDDGPSLFQPL